MHSLVRLNDLITNKLTQKYSKKAPIDNTITMMIVYNVKTRSFRSIVWVPAHLTFVKVGGHPDY